MKLGKAILCVIVVSLLLSMAIPMASGGKKPNSPVDPTMDGRVFGDGDITNVAPNPGAKDIEYVPGEILVGFQPGMKNKLDGLRKGLRADTIQDFSEIDVQHWKLPSGLSVLNAVRKLSANPDVRFAEPNYYRHVDDSPNDPLLSDLWGLHNLGQTGGTEDADIDALEAWEVTTGSSSIVVGVIDSGVDYMHEDLAANIWTNPGDPWSDPNDPATGDGVDNDGNGYVDDYRGWDFRNDDNDPMDDYDHGTHVAGTIGAVGNNGIGIVGVNWNVKIMPLKFLSYYGYGTTADAIEAINYAAWFEDSSGNKIVRVTSNSYGGGKNSKAEKDAIKASGALFVASAGNSGSNRKMYPAGYPLDNIVAVAATDHDDELWSGSNYGSWVHLAAPGVNVLSTVPEAIDPNKYASFTGTSMACPHVSGTAGLILAEFPSDTVPQLKARILDNVDVLPGLSGKVSTSGRLNANGALGGSGPTDTTPPDPITDLEVTGTTSDSVTLEWTATGDDGSYGTAYLYDLRYRMDGPVTEENWDTATQVPGEPLPQPAGSLESFTVTPLWPNTTYHFAIKAVDEAGNPSGISNSPSATTEPGPGGAWDLETVDDGNEVGTWISMAVDGAGNPHISYADYAKKDIKYAGWIDGAWLIEKVPTKDAKTYRWTSIAVDDSNNIHMIYFSDSRKDLKYAYRAAGGGWTIELVDSGWVTGHGKASAGNWNSIVVDATGNPHVSYRDGYDDTPGSLKYAYKSGGQWHIEIVDDDDRAALRGTSIALDSFNRPRIAYNSRSAPSLRYAYWTGNAWVIEPIDDTPGAGGGLQPRSLALDASDNPHVSYCVDGGLNYAKRELGVWTIDVVDSSGCGDTNIVLDDLGNPHISYYYSPADDAKYAWWDGTKWVIELVDGAFSAQGWWASICLDNVGDPMLAYTDIDNIDLRFARRV
jgi:subtilisin family serine protease